ncbi:MAG: threonine--tRNA ligase [Deltaproteobacteria bacterium]|nr:threonine--tRNA ligase [Deltaproteobacteria bacterium]MCZ6548402.1 threonine--tRNA ligase [Deltaproteobacteria bacterium]MCZ6563047.1 threonine--tRNA ligase [Deltaproteobacteria bacterium]MCZ6905741.1 threonine--tRNA ligase [Deltaproteobacteria bacterium]
MNNIHVKLPEGKTAEVSPGLKIQDFMSTLELNGTVIAAKIDGLPVDLDRSLSMDCTLDWIPLNSPEGLSILRHSTAHLMAQAVQSLFPGTQVTIGPTIEDGFYYDFKRDKSFTPEEIGKIEAQMQKLAGLDLKVTREEMPKEEAIKLFHQMGEEYKVAILTDISEETVSLYRQGNWVDLCRGPHVPSTGIIQAFKLTGVAGAYWRGDEKNEMLQRIYGTSFPSQELLREHLHLLEEAKKRDHRRLGRELDLFSFHPIAPASPFLHPKGTIIYNELISHMRQLYLRFGYQEVITPQIFDVNLWRQSGHYDHFKENMFFTHIEDREFGVKPMNCPGHTFIYSAKKRSYRDLPLRLADFGRLHRYEKSGVTAGLTRVRTFSQDDAHIFCAPEQIEAEMTDLLKMFREVYETFQFNKMQVKLSTRPEHFIGSPETWERAENSLAQSLKKSGIDYQVNEGDGAFYGPKIDFVVTDAMRRGWQLGTIQLDFSMPERFDLTYVTAAGSEARPVMIHRAILGSIERFMGILIEHTAGAFPLWLAPVQLKIMTVTDKQKVYAQKVYEDLKTAGWRTELDDRNEKLGYKIREAQVAKVPYALIIGDREMRDQTVSPRRRGGENLRSMSVKDFTDILKLEIARKSGELQ